MAHAFRTPRLLRKGLSDRGSLTRRLQAHYADFRVQLLARGLERPFRDEIPALGLRPGIRAYVRNVLLIGNGEARVFAHSVLPHAALRGGWNGISRLGSKPLGASLFSNPRIQRLGLTLRRIDARHPLYHAACAHTGIAPRYLWARRSVFCLNGHPLMVSEVFLPAIDSL
ncbi:MAG: chorismate--pyruvate lyase [Hydrogenophilales bacterium 28-61-11]|nr:MAG: chorismate--pyruvate lyase [Hydrogenophilales bacterium 28-61-11]OYZ56520.1 MAG: chorismate--pyruvate lyase [Hydrogenophilales bacterium 16-61-112]OZA43212.1 MAG: chorismate--pyruvate lyase [Hydrogenophilales bacterium 17-61-76]